MLFYLRVKFDCKQIRVTRNMYLNMPEGDKVRGTSSLLEPRHSPARQLSTLLEYSFLDADHGKIRITLQVIEAIATRHKEIVKKAV